METTNTTNKASIKDSFGPGGILLIIIGISTLVTATADSWLTLGMGAVILGCGLLWGAINPMPEPPANTGVDLTFTQKVIVGLQTVLVWGGMMIIWIGIMIMLKPVAISDTTRNIITWTGTAIFWIGAARTAWRTGIFD